MNNAGVAQWQSHWLPTRRRGFDSLHPLQKNTKWVVSLMVKLRFYTAATAVRFCHDLPFLLSVNEELNDYKYHR